MLITCALSFVPVLVCAQPSQSIPKLSQKLVCNETPTPITHHQVVREEIDFNTRGSSAWNCDWYKVNVPVPGDLRIFVEGLDGAPEWDVYLVTSLGCQVLNHSYDDIVQNDLAAGDYLIALHGGDSNMDAGRPYSLVTTFYPNVREPFQLSCNETPRSITFGQMVTESIDVNTYQAGGNVWNCDWYKIRVPERGDLRIEVDGVNGSPEWDVYLVTSSGCKVLVHSYDDIEQQDIPAGEYLIAVHGGDSNIDAGRGYTLVADFSGKTKSNTPKINSSLNLLLNGDEQ